MRTIAFTLAALALAGCGQAYQIQHDCRVAAGPQPNQGGMAFGLIGTLAMISTPEWQDWDHQIIECVEARRAAAGMED